MSSTEIPLSWSYFGNPSPSRPTSLPLPPTGDNGGGPGVVKSPPRPLHPQCRVPEPIELLPTETLKKIGSYLDDMDVTCLALAFPSILQVYGRGPLERSLGGLACPDEENYDIWKRVWRRVRKIMGDDTWWLCIPCRSLHGEPQVAQPGYKDLGERDLIIDIIGRTFRGKLLCIYDHNIRQLSRRPPDVAARLGLETDPSSLKPKLLPLEGTALRVYQWD